LHYLNNHLTTNVLIYEVSDDGTTKLDFLAELDNLNIQMINEKYTGIFHRMQYLNTLLNYVTTPVVCNYDIDVALEPETYATAQDLILNGTWDMLFPYEFGTSQVQIHRTYRRDLFKTHYNLLKIPQDYTTPNQGSQFGHCIFFSTEVYRKGGGENENFISWGPEDKERPMRFNSFGYEIGWLPKTNVWHFEHVRGTDSSTNNPQTQHNWDLYNRLTAMTPTELLDYYQSQDYIKKYDNFLYPEQKQPKVS